MTSPSIVAVTEDIKTAGCMTWWHLEGDLELADLTKEWESAGLDTALLPSAPTPQVAFSRAAKLFATHKRLVRRLSDGGYAVVTEYETDDGKLRYVEEFRARLNAIGWVEIDGVPKDPSLDPGELQEFYKRELDTITTNDVSAWLAKLVVYKLNSVPLRLTGGIYFIPRFSVTQWRTMVTAIREASHHVIYEVPALHTDEAVEAVIDSLTAEAASVVDDLEGQLNAGDLGAKALRNRAGRADAMREKLLKYEHLLGASMEALTEKLYDLKASLAAAALAAEEEEGR